MHLLVILVCLVVGKAAAAAGNSSGDSIYANASAPFGYTNSYSAEEFQYRGVALGGWLVLEPYITPSLFLAFNATSQDEGDIPVDEYHYCKQLGRTEAAVRLQKHWSTFYTEADFAAIRAAGFNMVRIPIGYWAFYQLDDDPYVAGAQDYLDMALGWAHAHGLKVWIDLHGAPGSQNGFDNSGLYVESGPQWQKASGNVALTRDVLRQVYAKYGGGGVSRAYNDTVLAIEVLNEPFGPKLDMAQLAAFYNATYLDARLYSDTNNTIVLHDAFQAAGYWNDFMAAPGAMPRRLQNYNLLIDHHHYEVFSAAQLNASIAERLDSVRGYARGLAAEQGHHPAVVGEWSAALTDCAPWLNGVRQGHRWDGSAPYTNARVANKAYGRCADINSWGTWSPKHKRDTRKFVEMQLDQYEQHTHGWIFWCYKTETAIEWDFTRLAALGLFPQPFADRRYVRNGTDTRPDSAAARATPRLAAAALAPALAALFLA